MEGHGRLLGRANDPWGRGRSWAAEAADDSPSPDYRDFRSEVTVRAAIHRELNLDNLTHTLVGAAIAKAGADRATPLATATLVIAANAPDVDVLSYVRGEYFALAFRRGITHGWPALVVMPFAVAAFVLAWDRWVRRRRRPDAAPARAGPTLALSALGLVTHPMLDWLNTYGMRWSLPFDGSWSYGDALFIVDPWIWLLLGGAVFLSSEPGRWGLVGWATLAASSSALVVVAGGPRVAVFWGLGLSTIALVRWRATLREVTGDKASDGSVRASRSRRPGGDARRGARFALACTAAYIAVLVVADRAAREIVREAAEAAGLLVRGVLVAPLPANPFESEVEVLTQEELVPGTYSWIRSPRVALGLGAAVPLLDAPPTLTEARVRAVLSAARATPTARDYLVWSRYPYIKISPERHGWRVRFSDARYDAQPEALGLAGVSVWVPDPENP